MAMTKSELFAQLAEKTGMKKSEVKKFWETLLQTLYSEAKKGEAILPGLGKLVKKERKARLGRNPKTGEQIQIPAKTVVKFRVAKAAKDEILG